MGGLHRATTLLGNRTQNGRLRHAHTLVVTLCRRPSARHRAGPGAHRQGLGPAKSATKPAARQMESATLLEQRQRQLPVVFGRGGQQHRTRNRSAQPPIPAYAGTAPVHALHGRQGAAQTAQGKTRMDLGRLYPVLDRSQSQEGNGQGQMVCSLPLQEGAGQGL